MNHLDDDAELYALGLTDRDRNAEIESHIAGCAACRTRVVNAESAAAALAAALPPAPVAAPVAAPRRATWWPGLATAAAFVFAATAGVQTIAARDTASQLARTDGALTVIASSHFNHTTLTAEPGVIVKVLYARDGAWCYVVATGVPPGSHLVLRRGAVSRDAGTLDAAAPATLFVRAPGRNDEVAVVNDGRTIAHGTPIY
jgi:hypothetical protein